jgi:hypothetical protein
MTNELSNGAAILALAGLIVYLSLWPYMTGSDE